MADTRLPHWTICAALALVATGVAAEPMGEATRHVSTVGGRERTFIEYVPKTLKPGAPLLIEESPISLGLIQSIRENSVSVTPYRPDRDKRARLIAQSDFFAAGSIRLLERAAWLEEFVAELLAFSGAPRRPG